MNNLDGVKCPNWLPTTVNGFAKKPNLKNKSSINNKKMNRDEKFN